LCLHTVICLLKQFSALCLQYRTGDTEQKISQEVKSQRLGY
jgi:hypothetical protein